MKLNDIVEVYPYGYDERVRQEMGRIAVVIGTHPFNEFVEIKFTDKKREKGFCVRDTSEKDAYQINGRRDVWYNVKVIDGQGS